MEFLLWASLILDIAFKSVLILGVGAAIYQTVKEKKDKC